ncbi:hypothetical protein GALL_507130 [mine drainage metagenome]|uniref:Uncharacterized protein n=1 Tax=mine drainage metagenome TaxID=410659 RepID=A0A1J5P935_9ZZZZ
MGRLIERGRAPTVGRRPVCGKHFGLGWGFGLNRQVHNLAHQSLVRSFHFPHGHLLRVGYKATPPRFLEQQHADRQGARRRSPRQAGFGLWRGVVLRLIGNRLGRDDFAVYRYFGKERGHLDYSAGCFWPRFLERTIW